MDNLGRCRSASWRRTQRRSMWSGPISTDNTPDAAVQEGVDELTCREGEEGTLRSFISTAKVEADRWGPEPVEEDWRTAYQAIYKGVGCGGMGKLVPQVRGDEQGSGRSSSKRKQQGEERFSRRRTPKTEMTRATTRPGSRTAQLGTRFDRNCGTHTCRIHHWPWRKRCRLWTCGAALAPRRREGAGVEWVFLLSFSVRQLAFAVAKVSQHGCCTSSLT